MDFSPEDLIEAIDRAVLTMLSRHGMEEPPVDTIGLAQEEFGFTITEAEDEEEERSGRFGPRPPRRRGREIVFRHDQTEETRSILCARACAREMIAPMLEQLGVTPGTEHRSAQTTLVGMIAPRLLLPSRWFERDARRSGYDLAQLKERYETAGYELIAWRWLDLEEACIVAVVDDGTVASRRGNRAPAGKQLTEAEQRCLAQIAESGEAQKVRRGDWTVQGWPIPNGPFNRIILRAVPDEI